jgi:hypothetical protein
MTHRNHQPHDLISEINNRLEVERVAAGDFLFGLIDANQLVKRCKEKGLMRVNILIFLLEQAGAQPLISNRLNLEAQKEGIKKMGELICTRYFQNTFLEQIYFYAQDKHSIWLSAVADILAREIPTAFLKALEIKPDPYMKSDSRDKAIMLYFVDSLSDESRVDVISEAMRKKKLCMLLKKTGWEACKAFMKTGNNRRILLTIEMGL